VLDDHVVLLAFSPSPSAFATLWSSSTARMGMKISISGDPIGWIRRIF
jgi:hypothetical protein